MQYNLAEGFDRTDLQVYTLFNHLQPEKWQDGDFIYNTQDWK